jgi:hypothetical protein
LVHELVHLKRRDHMARMMELATVCLYWWHPVAWWARRNAERAAEHCCDAAVVAHLPGARRVYAEALVATVDFLSAEPRALPLGASGFSQLNYVKRRMEMILEAKPTRRRSWSMRLVVLAISLVVLPLSVRALWAEPAVEEAKEASTEPDTKPASAGNSRSIEERLDRLEKMIEKLTVNQPPEPPAAGLPSMAEPSDEATAVFHELAEVIRQASYKLELNKTNCKRLLAAERQAQAVQKAYEAKAVTIDHVLEAQRRSAEAEMGYYRTSADLCDDPARRRYLLAAASLHVSNQALNEARKTWQVSRLLYNNGESEAKEEAQAREQFYQFKKQAETCLKDFQEAEAQLPRR